ncbi:hypothetical protein [Clostridium sp. MD294]|uniref:hypothetical protein n=1 Tax=Clostridium sp. MD294 TaxID=97138 RepID=UPI0002CAE4D4|nr:hypothetical protein [Clostridium sp. MD294]NDO46713.1 hypothetical protein [Clostridium sp. MD294]USF28848.1 hypothetical protein C820_000222 [Clostridium sp. MD294]
MGIYKVIKIKLPKFNLLQKNNKTKIKKNIPKRNIKNQKNILKKPNYSTKHKNKNSFSYYTMKTIPKKHKKEIHFSKMKLKYVIIGLFLTLILIKGIIVLHHYSEQKQVQNTDAVVETKTNFFVKESLPY